MFGWQSMGSFRCEENRSLLTIYDFPLESSIEIFRGYYLYGMKQHSTYNVFEPIFSLTDRKRKAIVYLTKIALS